MKKEILLVQLLSTSSFIMKNGYSLKILINIDWNSWKQIVQLKYSRFLIENCTWRWNFWMISIGIPIEMLYGMANWEQKFVLKSEIRSTHVRDSVCAQALKCHFYWHLSLLTAISTDFCTTMALHLILKNWQRTLYGM